MLDMRSSLLDIQRAPHGRPTQPATVIRMDIQARHRLTRRQHDRQLQLCVPLVVTNGDSYRMREARAKGGTTPKNN
jgi:hypothetical protein